MSQFLLNNSIPFNNRDKAVIFAEQQGFKEFTIDSKLYHWEHSYTDTGYKYSIHSLNDNSYKYGKCRICGEHATEIFYQVEEYYYKFEHDGEIDEGWTQYQCNNYFGHKECLLSVRR